jgi:PBP1b-binding outer membrane lipoprotein LpoB
MNMKKRILLLITIIIVLFSSCAYQKYNARSFKPNKKDSKIDKCKTYSDVGNMSRKYYYKQR